MIIKNERAERLIFVVYLRLILDGVAGLKFAFGGKINHTWAIVKAHWAVFGSVVALTRKRKKTNTLKTIQAQAYPSSILVQYYLMQRKKYSQLK
jgi:hypothetical protein